MNTQSAVTPFDPQEEYNEIITVPTADPIVLGDVLKQMGLRGTPISAKELIDTTFDVLRARQFKSELKEGQKPYFCIIRPVGSDELYQVVLGSGAIIEALDAFCAMGVDNPVRFTLRWKERGPNKSYYYFE